MGRLHLCRCRPTRLRLMGALSLTRRKPRGRSGLYSTPGLASTVRTVPGSVFPRRRGQCSPGVARPVSIGPHFLGSITGDPSIPHSGVRSAGDSIYDKSLTGEPILPSRTANQYLARSLNTQHTPAFHKHREFLKGTAQSFSAFFASADKPAEPAYVTKRGSLSFFKAPPMCIGG